MRKLVEKIFERAQSLAENGLKVDMHGLTQAYEEVLRAEGIIPLDDTVIFEQILKIYNS